MGVAGLREPALDATEVESVDEPPRNAAAATTKLIVIEATRSRRELFIGVLLDGSDAPCPHW